MSTQQLETERMCAAFLNEEGMLQYIATKIGVTVFLTPKCHAELAL